jgi:hypothetical protein
MRLRVLAVAGCLLFVGAAAAAESAPPATSNAEMKAIFDADQADRAGGVGRIDWAVVAPRDEARQARTKELLSSGALQTGDDYYHAAFVFQHGAKPDDYLMAHALGVAATARGHAKAAWIAAASLDRYLQNIGQPQIYGTQYLTKPTVTQEPYNRTLVPDALRTALGVATQAEQEKRRQEIEARVRQTTP